jgi:hypothetical protein
MDLPVRIYPLASLTVKLRQIHNMAHGFGCRVEFVEVRSLGMRT